MNRSDAALVSGISSGVTAYATQALHDTRTGPGPGDGYGVTDPRSLASTVQKTTQNVAPIIPLDVKHLTEAGVSSQWHPNVPLMIESTSRAGSLPRLLDIFTLQREAYAAALKRAQSNAMTHAVLEDAGSKRSYNAHEATVEFSSVKNLVGKWKYCGTLFTGTSPNTRTGAGVGDFVHGVTTESVSSVARSGRMNILNIWPESAIHAGTYLWILVKEVSLRRVQPPDAPAGHYQNARRQDNGNHRDRCIVFIPVCTRTGQPPPELTVSEQYLHASTEDDPPNDSRSYLTYERAMKNGVALYENGKGDWVEIAVDRDRALPYALVPVIKRARVIPIGVAALKFTRQGRSASSSSETSFRPVSMSEAKSAGASLTINHSFSTRLFV
jgi:hypothetical protein